MNFFEEQDKARASTRHLLVLFGLALVVMVLALYAVAWVVLASVAVSEDDGRTSAELPSLFEPLLLVGVVFAVGFVVGAGSLYKVAMLSQGGGSAVARSLGGRRVAGNTLDPDEKRLLNVVEEMAIASGLPVPPVFILEEPGINAFAAGWSPESAVVGVTRGCVQLLSRDELQGVVAHEFSHVFNGDMRLNLRLIGVLHGVLIIGATGYWMMRAAGRIRGRNSGQIALALLGIGVSLIVIGYGGLLVGRLIKAAVSREREYLADASAVQFTRNPDGIGGALKKIGGLQAGSHVVHRGAEEASHLFFSDALRNDLSSRAGLTSTHPSLVERIRRIDPRFDGRFPRVKPLEKPAERPAAARQGKPLPGIPIPGMPIPGMPPMAAATALSGLAAGPRAPAAANAVLEHVGAPGPEHLDYSRALLAALPEHVRDAAREGLGAMAIVHCLLLEADPASREKHLRILDRDPAVRDEVQRLLPALTGLLPSVHMPLVDLCVPALRNLDAAATDRFLSTADALLEADRVVSPFESALRILLHKRLEKTTARNSAPRYSTIVAVRQEFGLVLSLVAWSGHDAPTDAMRAYELGLARLPKPHGLRPAPLPRQDAEGGGAGSSAALDAAVKKLSAATPALKQHLIEACVHTALADGEVNPREAELLRAVASALGAPLPPLIAQDGSSGSAQVER